MRDLLFIIPMKDPTLSKTRLAAVLPDGARQRLSMLLFKRTLAFLAEAQPQVPVLVVSDSTSVEAEANLAGARVLKPTSGGLNEAVQHGADWAVANGFAAICVLPADLADPSPAELAQLLNLRGGVVLSPAHDGGTNALLASPPDAISFYYGKGSCKAHQEAALAAHVPCTIVPLESFKYDIDTSADLARVRGLQWA